MFVSFCVCVLASHLIQATPLQPRRLLCQNGLRVLVGGVAPIAVLGIGVIDDGWVVFKRIQIGTVEQPQGDFRESSRTFLKKASPRAAVASRGDPK